MLCPLEGSVVCVTGVIGTCSDEKLRDASVIPGRMCDVALPVWCCSWLPMECCGLAKDVWEDSGDAVGSCAPCVCPKNVLLDRALDQALRGGGGGGAPGRGIGVSIETALRIARSPDPHRWKQWHYPPCIPQG